MASPGEATHAQGRSLRITHATLRVRHGSVPTRCYPDGSIVLQRERSRCSNMAPASRCSGAPVGRRRPLAAVARPARGTDGPVT